MINPHESSENRLHELLADRAIFGLTDEEQAELDLLLRDVPDAERDSLDLLVANLVRSSLPAELEPMPAHLSSQILAKSPFNNPAPTPQRPSAHKYNLRNIAGGLAIASCLLIAVGIWWINRPGLVLTVAEQRNQLLAKVGPANKSVIRMEWTATADPAAKGASGDVVWNSETQEGYMLFRGLVANNPTREQYQLWVFDAARDERYPVDGGVFDIPPGASEVIVPIRVKLGVTSPNLFAVTVEPPGGVVVSSRERLPLLAKVPPRAS